MTSKRQRRRLFRKASIRERINSVQCTFVEGSARPVNDTIIFPSVDVNPMLQPYEDVLILTLGVGGFDVRRILVDLGSSIDLLQMSTYKQMSYSSSALENTGRLLSEFNGATTTSLGDVLLPIQVGSITLKVRFSMVNDLSSYNAIMERAWLHKMKVIPSTYHQMMSYLTKEGQVDLLGNRLVVRQCYQVTLESGHPTSKETHLESSNARE